MPKGELRNTIFGHRTAVPAVPQQTRWIFLAAEDEEASLQLRVHGASGGVSHGARRAGQPDRHAER